MASDGAAFIGGFGAPVRGEQGEQLQWVLAYLLSH